MKASDKVLVDTSAWIAFFAGDDRVVDRLRRPMRENRILVCGQVKLELLQGARDEKKFDVLLQRLSLWTFEAETPEDFVEAARTYAGLRWTGVTVPSADCLIAEVAKRCGCHVCATDPDFARIPGVRLFEL